MAIRAKTKAEVVEAAADVETEAGLHLPPQIETSIRISVRAEDNKMSVDYWRVNSGVK